MESNDIKPFVTTRKNCRISRNKKQYWKKSTKVENVEDSLNESCQINTAETQKQNDNNLYEIDRKSKFNNNFPLTRRQMAAMMKRVQKKEPLEKVENVCHRKLRTFPKKPLKQKIKKAIIVTKEKRKPYDLWGLTEQPQEEIFADKEYYFRVTKKKLPREPRTLKHITSILPHVEVDPTGASYNPPVTKYLDYIAEVAEEEKKKMKEDEMLKRCLELSKNEKYITQEEKEAEMKEGLDDDNNGENGNDEAEILEENEMSAERKATKNKEKRRTKKARRRELLEKKRMELKNKRKFRKKQMHLINSVRKLTKEIRDELQKQEELAKKRGEQKVLRKFAGTQRLGRGKFVPCEKPVLLPEELPSSLRDVKPQGSILAERVKSWQKRNLLPVAGERRKRMKLKTKLRIKMKEDRKHKQVKLGTTLI